MSNVGYKQIVEHKNDLPEIKTKILNLSTLCRYKCYDKNNIKKQDRYYFDVTVNGKGLLSAYKHVCYFDNKEIAEDIHKNLRLKLYDQETKPFLQKIASNHFLTQKDKEKIYNIFDKHDKLKAIEEVILKK
jgi:hypothetical protein